MSTSCPEPDGTPSTLAAVPAPRQPSGSAVRHRTGALTVVDPDGGTDPAVPDGDDGPAAALDHLAPVYRLALREGVLPGVEATAEHLALPVAAVRAAVAALVDGRLLRPGGHLGALVPVDPDVAASLLISPMEREIYQRHELIAQIRDRTESLREEYARTGPSSEAPVPVQSVVGALEVRGCLRVAAEACRNEVLVLLSGAQDGDDLEDVARLCALLGARGVEIRIVCPHRSRADLTQRTRIKDLAGAGAQVRTVSHVPRGAVVLDRSVALLLGSERGGEAAASRVQDADVVAFLLDTFDHLWDGATTLDSFDSGYAEVADDLQQTIAALMAKGFTDEVLARKLGMSVRTCRRHIAALLKDLDAVSRFQAGVQAARRDIVASGTDG